MLHGENQGGQRNKRGGKRTVVGGIVGGVRRRRRRRRRSGRVGSARTIVVAHTQSLSQRLRAHVRRKKKRSTSTTDVQQRGVTETMMMKRSETQPILSQQQRVRTHTRAHTHTRKRAHKQLIAHRMSKQKDSSSSTFTWLSTLRPTLRSHTHTHTHTQVDISLLVSGLVSLLTTAHSHDNTREVSHQKCVRLENPLLSRHLIRTNIKKRTPFEQSY